MIAYMVSLFNIRERCKVCSNSKYSR